MSLMKTTRSAAVVEVLLIDDDCVIREILAELLVSAGYGVTVADNGSEGLRRLVDGRFDVIVTDVRMPGLDGWEVARRLRGLSPDVEIIVMSTRSGGRAGSPPAPTAVSPASSTSSAKPSWAGACIPRAS